MKNKEDILFIVDSGRGNPIITRISNTDGSPCQTVEDNYKFYLKNGYLKRTKNSVIPF